MTEFDYETKFTAELQGDGTVAITKCLSLARGNGRTTMEILDYGDGTLCTCGLRKIAAAYSKSREEALRYRALMFLLVEYGQRLRNAVRWRRSPFVRSAID